MKKVLALAETAFPPEEFDKYVSYQFDDDHKEYTAVGLHHTRHIPIHSIFDPRHMFSFSQKPTLTSEAIQAKYLKAIDGDLFFAISLTGGSEVVGSGPAFVRPRSDFPRHQRAGIAFGPGEHCLQPRWAVRSQPQPLKGMRTLAKIEGCTCPALLND